MKHIRPHPNAARHQRILLWAGLWLAWMGELLAGAFTHFRASRKLRAGVRESLAYMTRVIVSLLFCQAGERATLPRARFRLYGAKFQRSSFKRALIGVAVRKAMRANSPREHVALLAAILRNPERLVRKLIARLETGLTRLQRYIVAREDIAACAPFALQLHLADTS